MPSGPETLTCLAPGVNHGHSLACAAGKKMPAHNGLICALLNTAAITIRRS
jgi:hypothetical protein